MSKTIALLLVLAFVLALCVSVTKPVLSTVGVAENTWVSKAPMHEARSVLGVAVVNGKIYAIGGSTQTGFAPSIPGSTVYGDINIDSFVGTNEEYDPASDTWTYKASMPTPRTVFATAVYQNRIYCIGGRSIVGDSSGGYTGVNEVYDPATDTWETKAPMPTARGWLQANVISGKIYLIGGDNGGTLNEVYDIATNSWSSKAPVPSAVSGYTSAVVENKIYVIGGITLIYDAETDNWSYGAPPPLSVWDGGAGAASGEMAPKRIYVLGEITNLAYDPENDSWTAGAIIPTRRYSFGVAVVNDRLYAIGGHTYNVGRNGYFETTTLNEMYTPLGYGTVPPKVSIVSPENKNYTSGNVSLAFTVNKPVNWTGYSLDGQENVTVTGNTTLSGLTSGMHDITVYAKDEFERIGVSPTIVFSIEEPFPATRVAAFGVSVAVVVAGLLIYFKKRNH